MTPEQEVDLLLAEPAESGAVVRLDIGYPGSPKTYSYVAVEAAGLWYVSGGRYSVGNGVDWGDLIRTLKTERATIYAIRRATTWENL